MFNIKTSCRTCMKNTTPLVNIYQQFQMDETCNNPISEILLDCLSIQVTVNDGLPENICEECLKALQFLHTFRKQAFNAEKEYKTMVSNNLKEIELGAYLIKTEVELKVEDDNFDSYEDFEPENFVPKRETEEKFYHCDICKKQYSKENKYLKHLLTHETPTLQCTLCGKRFHKQTSLDKHVIKHCNNYNKCNLCSMSFDTELLLMEHMEVHSKVEIKTEVENEQRGFQCSECNMTFNKVRSLAMHKKKHKNKTENVYQCDICHKEFKLKAFLKRHLNIHNSEHQFSCSKCPKTYSRSDCLQDHMKTHDPLKANVCSYCSKAFSQLCSLKEHMRIHTGETPFLCSQCGKGFNNSSNLRQHMLRHTGIRAFSCSLCPKTFSTKGQMTSHIKTHTGIHPYKCEQCAASFTKPSSLKKHKFIHLGVKPFACETCQMRFTCKDHLIRHCRIHTGEKPYKCTYCERAFTQSNDLVKHTRQHLGQNIYQCTVCDMRFRLKTELKQHYPTHYVNGEEPPTIAIDKNHVAPVMMLKPDITQKTNEKEFVKDTVDPTITITISRNCIDKNGLAGDITININPEKS